MRRLLMFAALSCAASLAYGQGAATQTPAPPAAAQHATANPAEPAPQETPAGAPAAQEGARTRPDQAPEIKPYDKVITKDAKSDPGVFTVHSIKEKIYYEIPKAELGKEFLWVSQIAKTTLGVGYGGQAAGNHVVRWERHNNRVLLRSVSYEVVADPSL
ncbi:MAG: DUF5118 domain-containing protein, partial [Pyrinomonadaceae bacterium]